MKINKSITIKIVELITVFFNILYFLIMCNVIIHSYSYNNTTLQRIADGFLFLAFIMHMSCSNIALPIIFIYNIIIFIINKVKKKIGLRFFLIWILLSLYNLVGFVYLYYQIIAISWGDSNACAYTTSSISI